MQAIIKTSSGEVVFLLPDTSCGLNEGGLFGAMQCPDITPSTHHIDDVPDNPEFIGGAWAYKSGWVIVDQVRVDALRQERAELAAAAAVLQARTAAKAARELAVSQITVTTAAGNTFDGDETSQGRMARAIIALQATGTVETVWVLANNTALSVSAAELVEALALSGAAQSAVWVLV